MLKPCLFGSHFRSLMFCAAAKPLLRKSSVQHIFRRMFRPVGIVGLPNVGKSTLFNALTKSELAEMANYPFCTINPNKANILVDFALRALLCLLHLQLFPFPIPGWTDWPAFVIRRRLCMTRCSSLTWLD